MSDDNKSTFEELVYSGSSEQAASDPWSADDENYETVYDEQDFQIPDAGEYDAEIYGTRLVDCPYEGAKAGEKMLKIRFVLDETYTDDSDNEQHYQVYSKGITLRYGQKSNLYKLCHALTGQRPVIKKRHFEKNGEKKVGYQFPHPILRGMKCKITVVHKEHEGNTYANVNDYKTSEEQLLHNKKNAKNYVEEMTKDATDTSPSDDA